MCSIYTWLKGIPYTCLQGLLVELCAFTSSSACAMKAMFVCSHGVYVCM